MSGARSELFELPSLAGLAQADGIGIPREEQALIASIRRRNRFRSASTDGPENA